MGKPVSSNVSRVETKALNTKVNKRVFEAFKDYCAELGYPMNVVLETFMRQYTNGRFKLEEEDILKFKDNKYEVDTLNSTFSKEIYLNFKNTCKSNGYFVRYVVAAFMEKIATKEYVLEYVNLEEIKR
jgi:hypothetical protein